MIEARSWLANRLLKKSQAWCRRQSRQAIPIGDQHISGSQDGKARRSLQSMHRRRRLDLCFLQTKQSRRLDVYFLVPPRCFLAGKHSTCASLMCAILPRSVAPNRKLAARSMCEMNETGSECTPGKKRIHIRDKRTTDSHLR